MPTNIGVLGLGLIGGSLLRRLSDALPVCGYDAEGSVRAAARDAGFVVYDSAADVVRHSEVVVLAVPLPVLPEVVAEVVDAAHERLVVTDVASVKQPVRELLAPTGLSYVGGHPMAGSEHSGFAASDPTLFAGATWVLCLEPETPLPAWLMIARLVTGIGCRVLPCGALAHDQAVARVSHLPHLAAAVLTDAAAGDPVALALGAGSFRDATRVAATRPELTAAMCMGNRGALVAEVDIALARLEEARRLLASGTDLVPWLRRAHRVRSSWPLEPGHSRVLPVTDGVREQLLEIGARGGTVSAVGATEITVHSGADGARGWEG